MAAEDHVDVRSRADGAAGDAHHHVVVGAIRNGGEGRADGVVVPGYDSAVGRVRAVPADDKVAQSVDGPIGGAAARARGAAGAERGVVDAGCAIDVARVASLGQDERQQGGAGPGVLLGRRGAPRSDRASAGEEQSMMAGRSRPGRGRDCTGRRGRVGQRG